MQIKKVSNEIKSAQNTGDYFRKRQNDQVLPSQELMQSDIQNDNIFKDNQNYLQNLRQKSLFVNKNTSKQQNKLDFYQESHLTLQPLAHQIIEGPPYVNQNHLDKIAYYKKIPRSYSQQQQILQRNQELQESSLKNQKTQPQVNKKDRKQLTKFPKTTGFINNIQLSNEQVNIKLVRINTNENIFQSQETHQIKNFDANNKLQKRIKEYQQLLNKQQKYFLQEVQSQQNKMQALQEKQRQKQNFLQLEQNLLKFEKENNSSIYDEEKNQINQQQKKLLEQLDQYIQVKEKIHDQEGYKIDKKRKKTFQGFYNNNFNLNIENEKNNNNQQGFFQNQDLLEKKKLKRYNSEANFMQKNVSVTSNNIFQNNPKRSEQVEVTKFLRSKTQLEVRAQKSKIDDLVLNVIVSLQIFNREINKQSQRKILVKLGATEKIQNIIFFEKKLHEYLKREHFQDKILIKAINKDENGIIKIEENIDTNLIFQLKVFSENLQKFIHQVQNQKVSEFLQNDESYQQQLLQQQLLQQNQRIFTQSQKKIQQRQNQNQQIDYNQYIDIYNKKKQKKESENLQVMHQLLQTQMLDGILISNDNNEISQRFNVMNNKYENKIKHTPSFNSWIVSQPQ